MKDILQPTKVYDSYWRFAAERQDIFFRRQQGVKPPWTRDPILSKFKFTNAYRASDRVSQYLIRNVIYAGPQTVEDIFLRTLLFKLFNRIGTWELLVRRLGEITYEGFEVRRYESVLSKALQSGQRIYSAAYIMPAIQGVGPRKHSGHLWLLRRMLREELPLRLLEARSLREAFELLRAYPMMGDFLAYQYIIDLNYSTLLDFSEMEFVVVGPGARRGLRKCFGNCGGMAEVDLIRLVAERQEEEFERRGLEFQSLWGRPLQLIDCQNLFCEVDKYARVAYPEIEVAGGGKRIKQRYRATVRPIKYWYPPKWGINERIESKGA